MKKLFLSILLLVPTLSYADTVSTGTLRLILITTGTIDRTRHPGDKLNENFQKIDSGVTSALAGGGGGSDGKNVPTLGVYQNEVSITSPTAQINFKGAGVSLVTNGSTATVTIPGGAAGGVTFPLQEGATNYAGYRSTFTFQQPQTFSSSFTVNATSTFTRLMTVSSLTVVGTVFSSSGFVGGGSSFTTVNAGRFIGDGTLITGISASAAQQLPLIEGATNYAGYRSTFTYQQPQTFASSNTVSGSIAFSSAVSNGIFILRDGLLSAPSFSFASSTMTGMYFDAASNAVRFTKRVGAADTGTDIFEYDSSGLLMASSSRLRFTGAGTSGSPPLTFANNNGMYNPILGSGQGIGIVTLNTQEEYARFIATGSFTIGGSTMIGSGKITISTHNALSPQLLLVMSSEAANLSSNVYEFWTGSAIVKAPLTITTTAVSIGGNQYFFQSTAPVGTGLVLHLDSPNKAFWGTDNAGAGSFDPAADVSVTGNWDFVKGVKVGSMTSYGTITSTSPVNFSSNIVNMVGTLGITVDGGGSAITTGMKGCLSIPYDCTISSWVIIADISGSATFDLWRAPAPTIPSVANTITAAAKPTLTSAQYANSAVLTGWTTNLSVNDILCFNVDSAATSTRVHLYLTVKRR